eukprot:m.155703 g.155703  ORF g.155703 m.155703 type:complete len:1003 (+) comp30951_c0_seq1:152-3160(+)
MANNPNYVGNIPRHVAEEILGEKGVKTGRFIIRDSNKGGFAISVKTTSGVKHCKIHQEGDVFWIVPGNGYPSVQELLISCYKYGLHIDAETRRVHLIDITGTPTTATAASRFCTGCSLYTRIKPGENAEECSFCGKIDHPAETSQNVSVPTSPPALEEVFVCPKCRRKFTNLIQVSLHTQHCNETPPQSQKKLRYPTLQCLACRKTITGQHAREEYAEHVRTCTDVQGPTQPYQFWACHECKRVNSQYNIKCRSCSHSFPGASNMWTCKRCKCAYSNHASVCSGCGFSRHDGSSRVSTSIVGRRGVVRGLVKNYHTFKPGRLSLPRIEQENLADSNKVLESVNEYCNVNNEPFLDPEFLPSLKSLYINGIAPARGGVIVHHWRRSNSILVNGQPVEWGLMDNPRSSDVKQGSLGNCWFLSALALVAEKVQHIERIMLTKEISPNGVYQVLLFHAGEWRPMMVDDCFPCRVDGSLVYSSANRNQLWVALIEKAAASLYGSYEALQSGSITEGLRLLTGAPCATIDLSYSSNEFKITGNSMVCRDQPYGYLEIGEYNAMNELWVKISSAFHKGHVMGAGTRVDCSTKYGLKSSHAYSISVVWNPPGRRLLRLRDPHGGSNSWSGPWSKDSCEWTKELRREMPRCEGEDGMFWISFDDFVRYFATVDVCQINRKWDSVRLKGEFPQNAQDICTCFQVRPLQLATTINITLLQKELDSSSPPSRGQEQLRDLGLVLLHTKKHEHVLDSTLTAASPRRIQSGQNCEAVLDDLEGSYILVPTSFNNFNQTEHTQCIVDFHSSKPLMIEAVTCPPELLGHAVMLQTMKYGKCHKPFPHKDAMRLYEYESQFVVDNGSRSRGFGISLQVDLNNTDNFASTRQILETSDVVLPNHRQLVCAFSPLRRDVSTAVSYKIVFSIVEDDNGDSDKVSFRTAKSSPPIGPCDLHQPRQTSQMQRDTDPDKGIYQTWTNLGAFQTSDASQNIRRKEEENIAHQKLLEDFLALAANSD